jgi:hypothetical protein
MMFYVVEAISLTSEQFVVLVADDDRDGFRRLSSWRVLRRCSWNIRRQRTLFRTDLASTSRR